MAIVLVPLAILLVVLMVCIVYFSSKLKGKNKCCKFVNMVLVKIKDVVVLNMLLKMTLVSFLSTVMASGVGRNLSSEPEATKLSLPLLGACAGIILVVL